MESLMSHASGRREVVRPAQNHDALTSGNLEAMLDRYEEVLGMAPVDQSKKPVEADGPEGLAPAK